MRRGLLAAVLVAGSQAKIPTTQKWGGQQIYPVVAIMVDG